MDDIDKAVIELVDYVQGNARAYERAKIQREKMRKLNIEKPKIVTSRAEKISGYTEEFAKITQINADLQKQVDDYRTSISGKESELEKVEDDLRVELARTESLASEIKKLEMKQAA